jgi:hypothetical protein
MFYCVSLIKLYIFVVELDIIEGDQVATGGGFYFVQPSDRLKLVTSIYRSGCNEHVIYGFFIWF